MGLALGFGLRFGSKAAVPMEAALTAAARAAAARAVARAAAARAVVRAAAVMTEVGNEKHHVRRTCLRSPNRRCRDGTSRDFHPY